MKKSLCVLKKGSENLNIFKIRYLYNQTFKPILLQNSCFFESHSSIFEEKL